MDKPQIILYAEKSTNFTLFDTKWIPLSAKFIALGNHARGTGAFQIYELASGELKCLKEV
jgi:WD repeat-containing protein 92